MTAADTLITAGLKLLLMAPGRQDLSSKSPRCNKGDCQRSWGGKLEAKIDPNTLQLKDQVVSINRVTTVVKGGKNLSFSALVVVGDESGVVGYGSGKAKEV